MKYNRIGVFSRSNIDFGCRSDYGCRLGCSFRIRSLYTIVGLDRNIAPPTIELSPGTIAAPAFFRIEFVFAPGANVFTRSGDVVVRWSDKARLRIMACTNNDRKIEQYTLCSVNIRIGIRFAIYGFGANRPADNNIDRGRIDSFNFVTD